MKAALRKVIALDFGRLTATGSYQLGPSSSDNAELQGTAMLVTRDSLSLQWAPRWLQHTGLEVHVARSAEEALGIASSKRPKLMIVDASFSADNSQSLMHSLRKVHGKDVPLIALCANDREVEIATDADVTDIVRRPYDWQLITRRVVRAVRAHEVLAELRCARQSLEHIHSETSAAERDRARFAGIDRLTDLPNGERFRTQLHKFMGIKGESDGGLALLVVGLDRYRVVNEAVGRKNADQLLGMFASRLKKCMAKIDVIGNSNGRASTAVAARLGGARFSLMVSNANTEQVLIIRDEIRAELSQPFDIAGQSVYLTASIGAAMFPRDCTRADGLLHSAETAMLEAQESGSGFEFFTRPADTSSVRVLNLDSMLRQAVRNDELELAYQPILSTDTGQVVAAEALLRWNHADEGLISPADFVPVAEKTGVMQEIGDYVIKSACRQLRQWLNDDIRPIRMAVNISLCQLMRGDGVAVVKQALEDNELAPDLLEIELSERGVLNQRPEVVNEIFRLKAIGVRISVDDFGTGQAAISYLKDLPVDVIKIDRSYISGVNRSAKDEAIASGMVALARRLDATVIAEGVETEEQLEMLRQWGSHECQGFLFSPAISPDDFRTKFK
ncbi:MAG: putative bifunctional diguanylate cyclase/phosphodiesterase [Woeseiaceae bacterium]